jgi:lambda family phage portal protein
MSIFERAIRRLAPGLALARARNRAALGLIEARYDIATPGNRMKSWRPRSSDADEAGSARQRMAFIARDMSRNTPFAERAKGVIAANVIGDGIIPKVKAETPAAREAMLALVEAHFDTPAIDADGRQNLYGLQRLAMQTVVESGEVLIRRRRRDDRDGLPLPFQVQVLEPDYLDEGRDWRLENGNRIHEGIEYDRVGRRVAYWLFPEHPGSGSIGWHDSRSRRVPASEVLHIYRQDRPGQMRGVTWFAPIALQLQDLADHQEAQLVRQKIAACFAAFRTSPDPEGRMEDVPELSSITPGRIQNLAPGEDIKFAEPPGVSGYDEFTQGVLRSVAAGLGVTYEALTGDLSRVNFSSARMGRMEMDRNISAWQHLMIIPQMCQPIGRWAMEAMDAAQVTPRGAQGFDWVPPHRVLVDPTREIPALAAKVRAGFASRPSVIRELGYDPERVTEEIERDMADRQAAGLMFESDARWIAGAPAVPPPNDSEREPE